MNKTVRIAALGYYGAGNIGDELLLSLFIKWAGEQNAAVTAISFDPFHTRYYHGIDAVYCTDLGGIISVMGESNLFILGGGGIFQDKDPFNPCELNNFPATGVTLYAQIVRLAEELGLPTALIAQGIGPILNPEAGALTAKLFEQSDAVSVRDDYSRRFLENLGVRKDIITAPDPVFAYEPAESDAKKLTEKFPEFRDKKVLAMMIRNWPDEGGWQESLAQALKNMPLDWAFLWIPFQPSFTLHPNTDLHIIQKFIAETDSGRVHAVWKHPDFRKVAGVLRRCDGAVAMRLHGLILGLLEGLPLISFEYEKKVSEAASLANLIPEQRISLNNSWQKIDAALKIIADSTTAPRFLPDFKRVRALTGEAMRHKELLFRMLDEAATTRFPACKHSTLFKAVRFKNKLQHAKNFAKLAFLKIASMQNAIKSILKKLHFRALKIYYYFRVFHNMSHIEGFRVLCRVFGKKKRFPLNLYDFVSPLKPIVVDVINQNFSPLKNVRFSCVVPIKNEEQSIGIFLRSLCLQNLLPFELIIVDGGSSDKTREIITAAIPSTPFKIELISAENINIAQGRNIGLHKTREDIVVFLDAGCEFDASLLSNIVMPMVMDNEIDLVSGIFYPRHTTWFSFFTVPDWKYFKDWQSYLPSSKFICVRREKATKIGGYPEYLTLTGEDTCFDVMYRRISKKWIINKAAYITWDNRQTEEEEKNLLYRYGFGAGESGAVDYHYYPYLSKYLQGQSIDKIKKWSSNIAGYLQGRLERPKIEVAKRFIEGVAVIFYDALPCDPRAAALIKKRIEEKYKVIFVFTGKYPSSAAAQKDFIDADCSILECYNLADFSPNDFEERYGKYNLPVKVEIHGMPINPQAKSRLAAFFSRYQASLS